jgi:hypothetical protein
MMTFLTEMRDTMTKIVECLEKQTKLTAKELCARPTFLDEYNFIKDHKVKEEVCRKASKVALGDETPRANSELNKVKVKPVVGILDRAESEQK